MPSKGTVVIFKDKLSAQQVEDKFELLEKENYDLNMKVKKYEKELSKITHDKQMLHDAK